MEAGHRSGGFRGPLCKLVGMECGWVEMLEEVVVVVVEVVAVVVAAAAAGAGTVPTLYRRY